MCAGREGQIPAGGSLCGTPHGIGEALKGDFGVDRVIVDITAPLKDLDAAASLFLSQATQAPLSPLGLSGPLNLPFTAPLGTWGVVDKTQELSHPAFPSWHPTKAGGKAATA